MTPPSDPSQPTGQPPTGEQADDLLAADDGSTGGRVPFVPSDNTTLTSVIAGLAAEGYVAHHTPEPGGVLRCSVCAAVSPAAQYAIAGVRRLEGASDPDEMVAVVAATCPRCSSPGVAVLGFGPTAAGVDLDVVADLIVPQTDL